MLPKIANWTKIVKHGMPRTILQKTPKIAKVI